MNHFTKKISYRWLGLNVKGQELKGVIQAESFLQAKLELQKQGIFVKKISKKTTLNLSFSNPLKLKDVSLFSRQMAGLLRAGIPLIQSFDILMKAEIKPALKELISEIKKTIEQGSSFAEALSNYPEVFNHLFCQLIHAGEKSGSLIPMLTNLANYLKQLETIRRQIKQALVYPMTSLTLAVLITAGLFVLVIPQFAALFNAFKAPLPFFTRGIIALSNFFQHYWHCLFFLFLSATLSFFYAKSHSIRFSTRLDQGLLKLPLLGPLLLKTIIARFTRTLVITLTSGLPLLSALDAALNVTENRAFRLAACHLSDALACGQSLRFALENTKIFPPMVIHMVAIGEESGTLSAMLTKLADYYEEDIATTIDTITSLLEPLIMAILGLMIGALVLAIYLPIFTLGSIM